MAAILGDGSIPDGAVAIKIDVDTVKTMKCKGQYIYVSAWRRPRRTLTRARSRRTRRR